MMNDALQLPRLVLAFGAVAALPAELRLLGVRRPLLMSDAGLAACGVPARVRAAAPQIEAVFDRVTENPIFADCDAAAQLYREQSCDGIVALGGGSVIDAAKLTAVVAGAGGRAADYAGASERIDRVAPILAMPTTAGTGSEATAGAGVHPDARSRTTGIGSPRIIPKTAICDPELALTLPPALTAATGIDALTHCVEGYLATSEAPLADVLALDGLARINRSLERATQDGADREARRDMTIAAFAGGAAIQKGLGPAHAIAIACGDQGVHHGKLSAMGLLASLEALEAQGEAHAVKLRDIARAMGLAPGVSVSAGLAALMTRLNLPTTLAAAGYRLGDLDNAAAHCAASHFNARSPYKPNAEQYKRMVETVAG